MHGFSFNYIGANIVCVIVFGIILAHTHFNIDRREKQVKFDHVLIAFILYFLADCVWAAVVDGLLPAGLIYVTAFFVYIFMVATTYSWYEFVMAYEQVSGREKPLRRFLLLLPLLISTAALALHFAVAPNALISDNLETLPTYAAYLAVVPDIYVIAILFYTITRARKEGQLSEKKRHLYIGFFPLMVSVGGFVQSELTPYAPVYCFTCLILMLIFYIDSIEQRISLDPLTGLNNRGQLAHYCAQRSNLYFDGRLTVAIMMDVDRFKSINDTYGHAEGDKALTVVSDALKKALSQFSMPSFLCRYGGDEFIIITHPTELEEADRLIQGVRDRIGQADIAYPLLVSAGYATLQEAPDSIQECIIRADHKLYEDKSRRR